MREALAAKAREQTELTAKLTDADGEGSNRELKRAELGLAAKWEAVNKEMAKAEKNLAELQAAGRQEQEALMAESASAQALLDALERSRPAAVQGIRLFDVYRGKGIPAGLKSLAFRVVMQDTAKTLTDGEADAAMAQLTQVLAANFGAKLRA